MAQDPSNNRGHERFSDWPLQHRRAGQHEQIAMSIGAFNAFYEDEGFDDSDFAKQAVARGIEDPTTEFRCLLDYVFVWLMEGSATMACPSFEHYLLTVIGIIEETRYGSPVQVGARLELAGDNSDGRDIFYWGERPEASDFPDTWGKQMYEDQTAGEYTLGFWLQRSNEPGEYVAGLPIGWEGYNHPALSRSAYEHARGKQLRILRNTVQHLERQLKQHHR